MTDPAPADESSWLEQALVSARTSGDYEFVWPALLSSIFTVPVLVDDGDTDGSTARFAVRSQDDGPVLVITERADDLARIHPPGTAVALSGALLIESLHPDVGLAVHRGPGEESFGIRPDLVQRLRDRLASTDDTPT